MTRRQQWLAIVAAWVVLGVVGVALGLSLGKRRALAPAPSAQPPATATVDPASLAATMAAQTVQALLTQNAQNAPTATPAPPTAASTPSPTSTPTISWMPSPTPTISWMQNVNPSSTPTITPTPAPCHLAYFVRETIPDGTQMQPGQAFTKTWTLHNGGSCTWTTAYKVVFVQGNRMNGPEEAPLPLEVPPGYEVTVSLSFTAPTQPGTYRADYKLQDDKGNTFGLGPEATASFWVEIVVVGPTDTPTPAATNTPAPSPTPSPTP